ncbi:MAG: hypothetical protein K6E21_01180 [Bacilli bacterium]|nr:hypothetical protein [Bacilli bacterium]
MKTKRIVTLLLSSLLLVGCDKTSEIVQPEQSEHKHNYVETETLEAKCTAKGIRTLKCECGETKVEEIPALGHDYYLCEEVLPTYSYKGYEKHYQCTRCDLWFDMNNKEAPKSAFELEEAGDEVALSVNGVEKGKFVKTNVPNQNGGIDVVWSSVEGIELKKDDVISLNKPGSVNTKYGFFGDDKLDNKKVKADGVYNIEFISTPNGFGLTFIDATPVEPALVVKVNNDRYALNEVTYADNTTKTYIYGYINLNVNDVLTVVDEINNNTVYNYNDLADDSNWNVYDFHKGTNDTIVMDKAGKYGIEFSRGGDKKISITKAFAPQSLTGDVEVYLGENYPSVPMEEITYAVGSKQYNLSTWYAFNENIVNNEDNKLALANGMTIYEVTAELQAGLKFTVSITDSANETLINADHLVNYSGEKDSVTIDGNLLKVNKTGTYLIGYYPAYDSIFVYEMQNQSNNQIYVMGAVSAQLIPDSNNEIKIENQHFESSKYISFGKMENNGMTFLPITIGSNVPEDVAKVTNSGDTYLLMFYKAGTFTITYNVNTHVATITYELDAVAATPDYSHNLEITFLYMDAGNSKKQVMNFTANNPIATLLNFALNQSTIIMGIQIMDKTIWESYTYSTSDNTLEFGIVTNPDLFDTLGSFKVVKTTGNYNITFNLANCTIDFQLAQAN